MEYFFWKPADIHKLRRSLLYLLPDIIVGYMTN